MSSIAGIKTVTNTAAAVFAGSSALANRIQVVVHNLDDVMPIVIGPTLSSGTVYGITVEAGEKERFNLLASETRVIYAQSQGRSVSVEVIETA